MFSLEDINQILMLIIKMESVYGSSDYLTCLEILLVLNTIDFLYFQL